MMVRLGRVLAAVCAGLSLGGAAPAQEIVTLAPSAALSCMTPPSGERGLPTYDAELVMRKEDGTVNVELTFYAPDREPLVRVLSDPDFGSLVNAVLAHVKKLRVPCLPPGADAARIEQSYVFMHHDGRQVVARAPIDTADAARRLQAGCLKRIVAGERPNYPDLSRQDEEQGKFLVRLQFDSATEPPKTIFLAAARYPKLRKSVEQFLPGYRLPCLVGGPISVDLVFNFRMEGGARTVIKDMSLQTFVASASDLRRPISFDLSALDCPFDLRIVYFQPFLANHVYEFGASLPQRRDFLDFLGSITLRLPVSRQLDVLGDDFTLNVPCGTINL